MRQDCVIGAVPFGQLHRPLSNDSPDTLRTEVRREDRGEKRVDKQRRETWGDKREGGEERRQDRGEITEDRIQR